MADCTACECDWTLLCSGAPGFTPFAGPRYTGIDYIYETFSAVIDIQLVSHTLAGGGSSVQGAAPALVLFGDRGALIRLSEGGEVVHEVIDHLRVGELLEGAVEEDPQVGVGVPTPGLGVRQEKQLLRSLALEQITGAAARPKSYISAIGSRNQLGTNSCSPLTVGECFKIDVGSRTRTCFNTTRDKLHSKAGVAEYYLNGSRCQMACKNGSGERFLNELAPAYGQRTEKLPNFNQIISSCVTPFTSRHSPLCPVEFAEGRLLFRSVWRDRMTGGSPSAPPERSWPICGGQAVPSIW